MTRSYPFAMVFVVVRVINSIPAVAAAGPLALATTVWSVIAVACFLPSFVIAWQESGGRRKAGKGNPARRMKPSGKARDAHLCARNAELSCISADQFIASLVPYLAKWYPECQEMSPM